MRLNFARPLPVLLTLLLVTALVGAGCGRDDSAGDGTTDGAGTEMPPAETPAAETPSADTPPADAETPAGAAAAETPERDYQLAPDFRLTNVAGGEIALSELRGKVVLIDFWATWCGPCRASIPHLNTLHKQLSDRGFEIVGISVDRDQRSTPAIDLVRAFMKQTPLVYPVAMADMQTVRAYGGIRSIPTAFLVDREGRVRKQYVGMQPPAVLERDITAVLAEKPAENTSI
jgi:thiol-disulfide isomerase/thioredoxin